MHTKPRKTLWIKRILCAVLLLSLLLEFAGVFDLPALSEAGNAYIAIDGERVDELYLDEGEKITLQAVCQGEENLQYKWQIRHATATERWINISGANAQTLAVTHALLASITDENAVSRVRCVMKSDQEYISNTVEICMTGANRLSNAVLSLQNVSVPRRFSANTVTAQAQEETSSEEKQEDLRTHSIVINYLFDNNAIAFEPYGAAVAHNSSFSESVTSPAVVGYAPFRRDGEDYVDASVVNFNIEHVTEDITINVIYEPALVHFAIHHHLQNLHNDEYSLTYDYITHSSALTGSIVPVGLAYTEMQLPGFKALSYERLEVAADGSTVVEIRYDRNYYLVDFDMNGGYGTDPVYTRFGDTVGANTPIRHGYVFDGWELVSYNGHLPSEQQKADYALATGTTITVPAANLEYRARWITTQTTYTMVFWRENAEDSGYTYWGHLEKLGALSGSLVDGRDLIAQVDGIDDEAYFTFNESKTDKAVLVEGDGSTVVNVYYTRNYYKLSIKATGKCTIPANHHHEDDCYDYICGFWHVHSDACSPELTCQLDSHTEHTQECISCIIPEHSHSPLCTCQLVEHTHVKNCWPDVGNLQNSTPSGAPDNPEDGTVYKRTFSNTRYIYIKGSWYRYSGKASSGVVVDPTCGYDTEHAHSDECFCKITEHTHGLSCYRDVLHSHTESCYRYSCNTVGHEHSDSCKRLKCGITEGHTHTSSCNSSNSTNVVKELYRKYGQSLEDIWPIVDDNGKVYDGGERWKPSGSTAYTQVLVHITKMTPDSFTLTLDTADYTPYTMLYYMEILQGEPLPAGAEVVTYEGKQYLLEKTIKAKYSYVTKAEDFFDIAGFTQYKSNPSFSYNNQINISGSEDKKIVKFYYNRITDHALDFSNNGEIMTDQRQYGMPYGAKLESYYFVPEYPSTLEPNAYEFAGWYSSPGCYDGTEVDWNTLRMPEGNLLLYAKWSPIKHTVRVWLDSRMTAQIGNAQIVDHGAFAHAPAEHVTNGNYAFQGWFYTDVVNGERVEKAFNFTGIPVLNDMDIYAKWGSHVSVDYRVNYVDHLTGNPVADPTVGSALAGHNKTFEAKAGTDLYEKYRSGYYPLVNSHTITMSVDGTHEFTFRYVFVPAMPYAVRYVDAATGQEILPTKKVMKNSLSVVTETFERVDKMVPDAYQKRLILSANETDSDGDGIFDDNVITFYYSHDEVHAYYKVVHYIQNIATDGYREYQSVETLGVIGTTCTQKALDITGFHFNAARTMINGVNVPADASGVSAVLGEVGMIIELYYDRNEYQYTVRYVDGVTGKQLIGDKVATALFGTQITENAADLTAKGYKLSSDAVKLLNISVNESHNVIEFLYLEAVVSIKYYMVGSMGGGTLSRSSENINAVSGQALGSAPLVSNGYLFVGWYEDASCTRPVDPALVDPSTNQFKPTKAAGTIWKDGLEFFAKFIPKETTLTVMKSGWEPLDSNQSYLFRIQGVAGTETQNVDLTFTIQGNGQAMIAALPVGEYTVTELVDWSWRYVTAESSKRITLSIDPQENRVIFSGLRSNLLWLDGNALQRNYFNP